MTRAIDTSVAVKWFVAEEGQDKAEELIGQPLIAPELLLIEVVNVAWKKWRKQEIGAEQAHSGLQLVNSFVEIIATPQLAARALEIAVELNHPAYDCYFLAFCQVHEVPLITADANLINKCRETTFARWLEPFA